MELRDYPLEFVERTIDLINKVSSPAKSVGLDVTFLLNCTLGLIVATSENLDASNTEYFNKRIAELDKENTFPRKIAYINCKSDFKTFRNSINKKSLIGQLDNSFDITTTVHIEKYKQARNLTLRQF